MVGCFSEAREIADRLRYPPQGHRSVAGGLPHFAGIGGVYDETLMRRYVGMGVRLVLGGGDLGFMTAAATERAKMLRSCR